MYWLRRTVCGLIYLSARLALPALRLNGYCRERFGKCSIWAPPEKLDQLRKGVEYPRTADLFLFERLTSQRRILFMYHKDRHARCGNLFTICDEFMLWREVGVASRIVGALLLLDEEENEALWDRNAGKRAGRRVVEKTYDWMSKHSLPQGLVEQYRARAEDHSEVAPLATRTPTGGNP